MRADPRHRVGRRVGGPSLSSQRSPSGSERSSRRMAAMVVCDFDADAPPAPTQKPASRSAERVAVAAL